MLFVTGDIFGYFALAFVVFTACFMLVRRRLLKYTKNLGLLRKVHVYAATAAGLFIILHVAYFYNYPITDAILLGYGSAALAVFVWITGTAFLERFRDSLFFHGTMSLATIALIVVHSAGAGVNIPAGVASVILLTAASIAVVKAWQHLTKAFVSLGARKS
ncbi:MAG: hypothetical protein OK438_04840 [Thaumarchaeota archaeon]|nr:hypothetical protein [Nitrososphaerota archaeon]